MKICVTLFIYLATISKYTFTAPVSDSVKKLFAAVQNGDIKAVQQNANSETVNAIDENGLTPLYFTIENNDAKSARILIDNGANIGHVLKESTPYLFLAVFNGYSELIDVFVQAGVNVSSHLLHTKLTPLHMVAFQGNSVIAEKLINAGARLNEADNAGETPLHSAARTGNSDIAAMLVQNGADVNLLTNRGYTALGIAIEYGHQNVIDTLMKN